MLYKLAHVVRDKMPWLWSFMEVMNALLFSLRYGSKLKNLQVTTIVDGYKLMPIKDVKTEEMVKFFRCQPEEAFKYFHPHGFDEISIKRLQRNNSFLAYLLIDTANGHIAGYCFNRAYFHGKGFRGRMVDINYRGKGLGTAMNKILNDIGFGIGLRLYETVNKKNIASYKSALAVSEVKVLEEFDNGDLLLEIMKS